MLAVISHNQFVNRLIEIYKTGSIWNRIPPYREILVSEEPKYGFLEVELFEGVFIYTKTA